MINKLKFLILGAGPAGLSFATRIKEKGENSFLVLEKENEAGGLCRSVMVDGSPFDIGGGHFLDVRRPHVNEYLFHYMPLSEWNLYQRDSQILVDNQYIHHPIEANIWEMDIETQIDYLKSIAEAGCNTSKPMPENFVDWITWKLGKKIAEHYMLPYNQKMFGDHLKDLGIYWLAKLPDVNFEDTLRSCLIKHAYAKQPGHAEFYYPKKYGYGELFKRMAESIKTQIEYNKSVVAIDFESHEVQTSDGSSYKAEYIITTIPWLEYQTLKGMPTDIQKLIQKLQYTSIQTEYFKENLNTSAHWIYYPDLNLPYHRILVRHNFCPDSRGYWTETNTDRLKYPNKINGNFHYTNQYAYPLNTKEKPEIMRMLLLWAEKNNVYALGRWGEHCHYNSDAVIEQALNKADQLICLP